MTIMHGRRHSGILNINKPAGITSHDVVNRVRKLFGIRKVGHAGTLDPGATGVLLVCLGQATRLIEYLVKGTKVYEATLRLGQTTNTYDADGEILTNEDTSNLSEACVRQAFDRFVGKIEQVPPVYSAIKKKGVPLYKLARQGIAVEIEPRVVRIDAIELVDYNPPSVTVKVTCQAGTYIRSLAHDVGQMLGVGAHLTQLIRQASGSWTIAEAVSLDVLAAASLKDQLGNYLLPKEKALVAFPRVDLSVEQAKAIRFGQTIAHSAGGTSSEVAGYDDNNRLVAILTHPEPGKLKPKKVFQEEA